MRLRRDDRVKTNFLGGVTDGVVSATATPLHAGRSTMVVETELRDGDGRLVGTTTRARAMLHP